jgi:hypothetical protein
MPQQVVAGERTVKVDKWLSEHRTFQVSAGAATDAKVHAFYYPLWSATAAGKTLPTRNDQDGTLIISLPPEAVTVDLAFREPLRSRISGIVSVIGWAIVLVVALLPRRDRKLKGAGRS